MSIKLINIYWTWYKVVLWSRIILPISFTALFFDSISHYFIFSTVVLIIPAIITTIYRSVGTIYLKKDKIVANGTSFSLAHLNKITYSVAPVQHPSFKLRNLRSLYKIISFYKLGFGKLIIQDSDGIISEFYFLMQKEKELFFFVNYLKHAVDNYDIEVVKVPFRQPKLFSSKLPSHW